MKSSIDLPPAISAPLDKLPISTEMFTEVEVRKVIKALKNNKSPSMDRISVEMLKARGEAVIQ